MGFFGFLTGSFVVLKLQGVIDWSWWLVFLPTIIAVAFFAAVMIFIIVGDLK